MTGFSELRINALARRQAARPIRHAVAAFLAATGNVDRERRDDILTAVGEALANAVEHAYDDPETTADVELLARLERGNVLAVDVFDRGRFIDRDPLPNRGFGLRIVEAIADQVVVSRDNGTRVHMVFALPR